MAITRRTSFNKRNRTRAISTKRIISPSTPVPVSASRQIMANAINTPKHPIFKKRFMIQ